jgi:hypothetical protein
MPADKIAAVDHKNEIFNFLNQSHISKKNIARLHALVQSADEEIAMLAGIVLDIAMVRPYKKKRLKFLAQKHRDLLAKLNETGLIFAHHH